MVTTNSCNFETGAAGTVLTGNGVGVAPTFQAAASGGGGGTIPQPGIDAAGTWLYWGYPNVSAPSPLATTNDRLHLSPLCIYKDITITKLYINVTAASGSPIARLGIYSLDEDNSQWDVVVDGGTFDCSSTGVKTVTISQALTVGTPYWFAFVSDNKSGSLSVSASSFQAYPALTTAFAVIKDVYKDTIDTDTALPSTVTMASVSTSTSANTPTVAFGIS